jgi:hypothetical protein
MKRICRDAWCGRRNTGSFPVRPADFLIRCQECSPIADYINRTLERLGVIKVVRAGDQNAVGQASEFRYLLSQSKNCAENAMEELKFRQSCQQSEVESCPRQYDNPEDALDHPEAIR